MRQGGYVELLRDLVGSLDHLEFLFITTLPGAVIMGRKLFLGAIATEEDWTKTRSFPTKTVLAYLSKRWTLACPSMLFKTPKPKAWNILSANILSAVFLNILSAVDG